MRTEHPPFYSGWAMLILALLFILFSPKVSSYPTSWEVKGTITVNKLADVPAEFVIAADGGQRYDYRHVAS